MCCENYDGPEKSPNQNNLVAEKPLVRQNIFKQKYVPKKDLGGKNLVLKKMLVKKEIWPSKDFGTKINVMIKKNVGPKTILGPTKTLGHK